MGVSTREGAAAARGQTPNWALSLLVPVVSLVVALLLGALVLAAAGVDPVGAFRAIAVAAFLGGIPSLADTATQATPLVFTGLACGVAFRAGLWNVGAEGQLLVGAWAATGVAGVWLPAGTSAAVMLAAMALAAVVAGAAWGAVPGLLRARFGVSEILSSLMLVYVAVQWNNAFVYTLWSDRGFQMTPVFPESAWMPTLSSLLGPLAPDLRGSQAHAGLVVAVVAAVVAGWVGSRTRFGFELRVMGASRATAHYAGIAVARRTVLVMALSGALAGLAGMVEVSGVVHRLQEHFSPGYGFTGILIAFLGRLNPGGVVLAAVLFGGLLVGAREVQPQGVASVLQGVVLVSLVASDLLVRRLVARAGPGEGA